MELEKNNEYVVEIVNMGMNGEGVAKFDGYPVFVKNAIIGEKVKIILIKKSKDYGIGKMIDIIEKSPYRQVPFCNQYVRCGGCSMQHIVYEKQLLFKKAQVINNFRKFGLDETKIGDIVGMDNPFEYRNKAQYPIKLDNKGNAVTGFYANRSHDVVQNDVCKIEHPESEKIIKFVEQYVNSRKISVYDEFENKGYLRHIIVKTGFSTKQIMVVLVTNGSNNELKDIEKALIGEFSNIKTIVQNVNTNNSNVIMGHKNIVLYGDGIIQDKIDEYVFNISSNSFYQVNPIQAQKLYQKAKSYIGSCNILFDLYCGVGTIGIYCNDIAKKVYGIEIVEEAIENAKVNARLNNINNIEFLIGNVENTIDDLYNRDIQADCILVDPPRKGLDKKLIDTILEKLPSKIVYISCNSATMVRDLQLLKDKYDIHEVTLFDLFPHTSHCEVIGVLEKKWN